MPSYPLADLRYLQDMTYPAPSKQLSRLVGKESSRQICRLLALKEPMDALLLVVVLLSKSSLT